MTSLPHPGIIKEKQLTQYKLGYSKRVGKNLCDGIQIDELSYQELLDEIVFKVEARVTVEKLEPFPIKRTKMVIVTVPRTWWDNFKSTYKGKWWMPLKKIKYRTIFREVVFTVVIYPMIAFPKSTIPPPPKLGDPVRIFELEELPMLEREISND